MSSVSTIAFSTILLVASVTSPTMAEDPHALLAALRRERTIERAGALVTAGDEAPDAVRSALDDARTAPLVAAALARHPVPSVREALESVVAGPDQVTGYHAARALGALGDPGSFASLATRLAAEPRAYWELASRSRDGWRPIFQRVREGRDETIWAAPEMPNLRVTRAALEALGALRDADPSADRDLSDRVVAVLERGAASEQHLVRYGAVLGLARRGGEHAAALLERVAASDPVLYVRRTAQRALGLEVHAPASGDDRSPPPSLDALRDIPAVAFIRTRHRSESNLGFRDSYFFPKTPWYAWGEDLWLLTPPAPHGMLRNLTELPEGGLVQGPDLSPDATRIAVGLHERDGEPFHIWVIDIATGERRRRTDGAANDVDPCWLADGSIAFSSDRDGTHEFYHQERTRALYVVGPGGGEPRQITFNPNQDYEPLALQDGTILYASYRFYGQDGSGGVFAERPGSIARIETQLRFVQPDGARDQLLYGAQRGGFYVPVRELPDGDQFQAPSLLHGSDHLGVSISQAREMRDGRIVCTTPAGLAVIDPDLDPRDGEVPVFPEVLNLAGGEEVYIHDHDDMNPIGRFTSPYPIDDRHVLVGHAPWHRLGGDAYGLWLLDLETGARTAILDEPGVSEVDPIPVVPRASPRRVPAMTREAKPSGETARVVILSVFESDLDFDRSRVRYVQVLAAEQLGIAMNANGGFRTRLLATVPIAEDGSVHVEVPADVPIHFNLVDEDEKIIVHETSFLALRPGESRSCIGCHEAKSTAPPPTSFPAALRLPPYRALGSTGDPIFMGRPERAYSVIQR